MMAADCLEALGIKRGDYVIKVNNRKVLDGVMDAIGLGGAENAGRRLTVLRAIDKLDRLGPKACTPCWVPGRKDESGDFTKGAGLTGEQIGRVIDYVSFSCGYSPSNVWTVSSKRKQRTADPRSEHYPYMTN